MSRDVNHIWLFGIAPNHQGLWHDHRNRVSWRVLPLVPGCQRFEDGFIYGLGKMLQVYSLLHHTKLALTNLDPNSPSHMHDMINRREALESYTGQLIQNVGRACSGRVRADGEDQRLHQLHAKATQNLNYVQRLIQSGCIKVWRLPRNMYLAHIHAAWGWVQEVNSFGGLPATAPEAGNRVQKAAFEVKRKAYLSLLSTLGWASGKWFRLMIHTCDST